ncbi:unnamed protein product [Acanthoscelides obtectus]|uniref:FAM20 C-terminal domain-containing protein n=1 Tax=Acanthoscelides obtectus TaxID=200917 RepID=A0A9P0M5W8_ACAOB|nr:unnamed protein product [Acanthoscelides obtectus]CAK1657434.1 Glycosaminoglycan xylosylkinase homolog [Acanthoscelides obtectus]
MFPLSLMFLKKNVLILCATILILFFITTNYLRSILPSNSALNPIPLTIEEKIQIELKNLPGDYKVPSLIEHKTFHRFASNIKRVPFELSSENLTKLWSKVNTWVTKTQIFDMSNPNIGRALYALKNAKILKADLDTRGTQLKFTFILEGDQQVIFKPQFYEKNKIIEGPVYAGKDRYSSEILGFYLSAILNKPLSPISVKRTISLKQEVLPVATKQLLDTTFMIQNRTCIYGRCFFCKKEDPVCSDENSYLSGAVIFNIKGHLVSNRSPWQRTYKKGKNAIWQELPEKYCMSLKEKMSKRRLYDLIDISIFDFLIQNGDRHHYETLNDTVVWLDNGKGFGNPHIHHIDILAPLYQCCILRRDTWKTLLSLTGGKLKEMLRMMPDIESIITPDHLEALDQRLLLIFAAVEYCRHHKQGEHTFI